MKNTNADFTCNCRSCRNGDQQQYNFQARLIVDCDDDLAIEVAINTKHCNVPIIETVKLSTMDEKYFKNSKFSLACFCAPREQPLSEYMKKQNKKNEDDVIFRTRQWIQSWANQIIRLLDEKTKRAKSGGDQLRIAYDSAEANEAVLERLYDLKSTLEFAEGSVFTKERPMSLPCWQDALEILKSLKPASEIHEDAEK